MVYRDADEEVYDEREYPDPEDMSSGDEPGIEPCPYCRRLISEEAERCPHCGKYLSQEDAPLSARSALVTVIILILVVAAVVGWMWGG